MQSKWIQLSVHIAAWMLFFSLPAIFMPQYDFTGESNSYVDSYFLSLHFLVTNLLLVAIFYFNALVLMPRLFFKKRFLEYALLVAALLVVFIYIPTLFRTAVAVAPPPPPHLMNLENMNDYFSHRNPVVPKSRYEFSVFVFLIIWLLSTGIKITEEWLHSEKKAKSEIVINTPLLAKSVGKVDDIKEKSIVGSIVGLNIEELSQENSNELMEVDIDANLNNLETMTLKKPNQVYYEIYKEARNKAKKAKREAIVAFLEAKNIKKTYMLDDLDESDDSDDSDLDNISNESNSDDESDTEVEENVNY